MLRKRNVLQDFSWTPERTLQATWKYSLPIVHNLMDIAFAMCKLLRRILDSRS